MPEIKRLTNADRIRQMTDEELARNFGSYICALTSCLAEECHDCKRIWLKQEVDEQ